MKKRIISLLLCLVLTVSLVPAAAAADTGDARTVTVRYASGHGIDTHDYEAAFTYSDDLFTRSGYTYRKDLALMSMGLAFAAYTSKDSEKTDNYATGNRNFVSMAEQCGFENIQSNKWMFQPAEADSIGISCASKTIRDNGGSYTLIAVGVRGNNYHAEWGGNARLDAAGEHKGFALGRDQVLDYLRGYIADTGISGRVKIWIAGYSRGAAVSNMVGGALDNGYSLGAGVSLSPHDLYCYCYEPPMGAMKEQVQGRVYDNIQNLVNIGRLIPQVAYYVYAYAKLYKNGAIAKDEKINVVVPTGNFGNILAAFYAKNMGLPIAKLICASNENKVLYDFFSTGTYDRNRDFILTSSPSMDILISSNLERLIYRIAGNDAEKNTKMMEELSTDGKYAITDEMRAQLADFYGNYTSEEETAKTIKKLYEDTGYIIDTHTAVAAGVYDKYKKDTGDTETKTVIASTASPFKFTRSVMDAIDPKYDAMGDFELVDELSRIGNVKVPQAIEEIRTAPVLHDTVCEVEEMPQVVKKFLGV